MADKPWSEERDEEKQVSPTTLFVNDEALEKMGQPWFYHLYHSG